MMDIAQARRLVDDGRAKGLAWGDPSAPAPFVAAWRYLEAAYADAVDDYVEAVRPAWNAYLDATHPFYTAAARAYVAAGAEHRQIEARRIAEVGAETMSRVAPEVMSAAEDNAKAEAEAAIQRGLWADMVPAYETYRAAASPAVSALAARAAAIHPHFAPRFGFAPEYECAQIEAGRLPQWRQLWDGARSHLEVWG